MVTVVMAVMGWKSNRDNSRLLGISTGILLAVVVLSLVNSFLLHLSALSLVISWIVVVLMSVMIYAFTERMKNGWDKGAAPSFFALNLFLMVTNLFTAILRILGGR